MNAQVLGQITELSMKCSDPRGSYEAMRDAIRAKLKEQIKICSIDYLKELLKNSVGTPEIEKIVFDKLHGGRPMEREEKERKRRERTRRTEKEVREILKMRIERGRKEIREAGWRWRKCRERVNRVMRKGSRVWKDMNEVEEKEIEKIKRNRKKTDKEKVKRMIDKYKQKKEDTKLREKGIRVSNEETKEKKVELGREEERENYVVYGEVVLSNDEKSCLQLGPGYREHNKVDLLNIETEAE
jgi:hypothetical protein